MTATSAAGKSILFDKKGYIEISGQPAEYSMSMTYEDEYPTDWFTITVSGDGSASATLEQTEYGYIVTSDNLEDVHIELNSKYDDVYTDFTTNYDKAMIFEITPDTLGVAVDADENGSFETMLDIVTQKKKDEEPQPEPDPEPTPDPEPEPEPEPEPTPEPVIDNVILGDLDGDGAITAADALTILRMSAGLEDVTEEKLRWADVDFDGTAMAADALDVLRFSAGLSINQHIGKLGATPHK